MVFLFDLFQLIIIVFIILDWFTTAYAPRLTGTTDWRRPNMRRKRRWGIIPYRRNDAGMQMDIRVSSLFMSSCGLRRSSRSPNRDTVRGFRPSLAKKTGDGFVRKKPLVKPVLQEICILCSNGAITPIIVKKNTTSRRTPLININMIWL